MNFITRGEKETRLLGTRIGRLLRGLDVVCLIGDLGSGKTTFTQGLARGIGFPGLATSPTFVLAKVYQGRRLKIYHLDLYRVAEDLAGDVGIEEYVSDPMGVCVIEWPQSGASYYPFDRLDIHFTRGRGEEERKLSVKARGGRFKDLLRRLK